MHHSRKWNAHMTNSDNLHNFVYCHSRSTWIYERADRSSWWGVRTDLCPMENHILVWYKIQVQWEFNLYQHQIIIFRQNQISISRSEGTYCILLCFKDHCQIIAWKSTLTGSQKFIKSAESLLQNELRIPLVRNSWASNGLLWSRLRCTRASHSCW